MKTDDSDRAFWDPDIQTMPRDELRSLQSDRLCDVVQRVNEGSEFFRSRFAQAGISPDDIKSVDDIVAIPPFRKSDLRENEAAHPPVGNYRVIGPKGAIRVATSTGTTGKPTFTLWTANDLRLDYELAARRYWRSGVRPGQVIANAHPGYLNGGQAIVAGAAEYMGCLPVSLGPPADDGQVETGLRTIEDLHIDHWHLMPAAASRIREVATRIDWTGNLPEVELNSPARQWSSISAGVECVGTLGSTCDAAGMKGSHIAEDAAVVEVVDPKTFEPLAPGQRGTLLCTSLARDNPLIRYNLEDVVRLIDEPCDCGETHRRAFWDGRLKDVVSIGGAWIMPIDVWQELPPESEFVIVRHAGEEDVLDVRVEGALDDDVVDRIRARTNVPTRVTSVPIDTFPRAAYKAERVVDEP